MKLKSLFLLIITLIMSCSFSSNDGSDEMMMTEEEVDLYEGVFISAAHPTSGEASVNEARTTISFTNFKTDSGPLLEVYLSTDTSASDYITLGVLQGVEGNFDYSLPEGVDFNTHKYVHIWCVDFSVSFGYAVLE